MSDPNGTEHTTGNTPTPPGTQPAPQPLDLEGQRELYRELVQKKDRTENEQDFLECLGLSLVFEDLLPDEEKTSEATPASPEHPAPPSDHLGKQ